MLVVRQRRAPVAVPSIQALSGLGPTGKEDVEGDREGLRVEMLTHFLGQAFVGRAGHGGGSGFPAHDEGRM